MSEKRCTKCGETKPLTEFGPHPRKSGATLEKCRPCRAYEQRARNAGIRNGMCAVCRTAINGQGICITCQECIEVMGGVEALQRAIRAVRFLSKPE